MLKPEYFEGDLLQVLVVVKCFCRIIVNNKCLRFLREESRCGQWKGVTPLCDLRLMA